MVYGLGSFSSSANLTCKLPSKFLCSSACFNVSYNVIGLVLPIPITGLLIFGFVSVGISTPNAVSVGLVSSLVNSGKIGSFGLITSFVLVIVVSNSDMASERVSILSSMTLNSSDNFFSKSVWL